MPYDTAIRLIGGPCAGQAHTIDGTWLSYRVPLERPSVVDELNGERRRIAVYVRDLPQPDGRIGYRFDGTEQAPSR